jgi:hypothetical protein
MRTKGGNNLYKELENTVKKEIAFKRRELRNSEIYERKAIEKRARLPRLRRGRW